MATNDTAQLIAAQGGPWTQIRTGTVAQATLGSATVVVGGTSFQASYIVPVGSTPSAANIPSIGSLVAIARQDSSWTILGRIAGQGDNLVVNGSFETTPLGAFPDDWFLANLSGTSTAIVVSAPVVEGSHSLAVTSGTGAAAQSYVYSSPIPVVAGDILTLSAYAGADANGTTPAAVNAALFALWFANATDLYPTTSSADSSIATATNIPIAPPFTSLSGSVTAPVTGFVRLALRSDTNGSTSVVWDFATLRRNEA